MTGLDAVLELCDIQFRRPTMGREREVACFSSCTLLCLYNIVYCLHLKHGRVQVRPDAGRVAIGHVILDEAEEDDAVLWLVKGKLLVHFLPSVYKPL